MSDGVDRPAVRVMVVDDHPMWRDAVERDLAAAGYDVVAVAAEVLQRDPSARVLILSASGEQRDVLEAVKAGATGMSYKQIAERLVLSHRTVQNHVQNTLGKLQMHNRVELTRYALERGLDAEPDA